MRVLAIDPHVRHMAYAVVDVNTESLVSVGTVKVPPGLSQQEVQDYWYARLLNPALVGEQPFTDGAVHLVIEIPDHLKSRSNRQLQSLVALSMSAAALCQGWRSTSETRTYEQIEPRTWKGNKKKEVSQFECQAIHGKKAKQWSEHECDAVAMGYWWVRRYKGGQVVAKAKGVA